MRAIPQIAVDFVKEHEARELTSYLDGGGVWTIGYGHTGPEVGENQTINVAKAIQYLREDLEEAGTLLAKRVKQEIIDALTSHQYAALISFVFNLGANPSWTIWKRLNAKAFDQVPTELSRFVYDQDPKTKKMVKVQGLVNRRAAETVLWSTREPGSTTDMRPSSETRVAPTPPAPSDPTPARKDVGLITGGATTVLAVGSAAVQQAPEAIKQGIAIVEPYADKSEMVGKVVSTMATVAAGLALLWFVLMLVRKWRAHK